MPALPNPFDSGAHAVCTPDEAVAPFRQTSDATVEFECLMDDICEIFAGARKLFDPDPAAYTNADQAYYDLLLSMDDPHTTDLIEMPYGMEGIFDPAPLFLRQVG